MKNSVYPVIIKSEKESVCYIVKINDDGSSKIIADSIFKLENGLEETQIDSLIANVV